MATSLMRFRKLFKVNKRCAVIGMIHVKALPGTPLNENQHFDEILSHAAEEAAIYQECGVDGIIVENMNDVPYTLKATPELVACMTRLCSVVRHTVSADMACGLQILAAQNRAALAAAAASDFNFIRAEGFVFSHVGDEGLIHSCAGELLRYRKSLGAFAEHISIFTDVKKKHSAHALTADVSIKETARAAEFFRSDGIIVTGCATGEEPEENDIIDVAASVPNQPVILGSGVNIGNIQRLSKLCHGVIVGSYFKSDGHWASTLDKNRVQSFMEKVHHETK